MRGCQLDYPLRVQYSKDAVVHAAREYTISKQTWNTFIIEHDKYTETVIPEHKIILTVCSIRHIKFTREHVIDNTTSITCKNCSKALGFIEKDIVDVRYVLQEIASDKFFKKTDGFYNDWVDNILDATLYKIKSVAQRHGEVVNYEKDNNGRVIKVERFFDDEKYKIRVVRLIVE